MRNESGIHPLEYKCLILLQPKVQKDKDGFRKEDSGLLVISEHKDREEYGEDIGTFVAHGSLAFTGSDGVPDWPNTPSPGDKVIFDKYQGLVKTGKDGKEYRILNDKELVAILEEDYGSGDEGTS